MNPPEANRESPPRAPLAFRVGVVGHRPNRLRQADLATLGQVLRTLLDTVADEVRRVGGEHPVFFSKAPPRLRAVSPLAEGVDRMFASAALDLGFELCCVMPFSQPEFERDFEPDVAMEPDALKGFHQLLERAGNRLTRFELDGSRADEPVAYGAAGRVVLNQSDILVAVWDGERQGKRGGTEDTFDEARRLGVPVIWVDAHSPHAWQIVDARASFPASPAGERPSPGTTDARAIVQLRERVREMLILPEPKKVSPGDDRVHRRLSENPRRDLGDFYAERQPASNFAVVWTWFRNLVADGKIEKVNVAVTPFEQALDEKEWPRDDPTPVGRLVARLRPFYAWPDNLAVLHSDRYRSAFVLAFLLAATAVGMALLPLAAGLPSHGPGDVILIVFELFAILAILGLVFQGRRRRWHERWIQYRLAAELVRTLRLVAPLGGARPFPQVPAHWASYGQPGATWMAWYVHAVERDLGLPSVRLERDYVASALEHLHGLLAGQLAFHVRNTRRCENIHHRLHVGGGMLIGFTLLACLLHLTTAWAPSLLTFCAGFFPALGAALAGIANQGEFRRISKRSEAMQEQLARVLGEAGDLRARISEPSPSPAVQESVGAALVSADAARLLVSEVLDWRVVVLDRPLQPPA